MDHRKRGARILEGATVARALFRAASAVLLILPAAGCSSSRSPSKAPEPPRPFELVVGEVREESVFDSRADSVAVRRSESTLRHFGRIERMERVGVDARAGRSREENEATYAVLNDSLSFKSDAPFRYAALMRRDTLVVTSVDKGPSTQTGVLDADRAMLVCIFEFPALLVSAGVKDGPPEIVDLKKRCAGGLYRRLNLPVTLGAFIFPVPSTSDRPGGRWESAGRYPGFPGLGPPPDVNMKFATVESGPEGTAARIEVFCDTTLTNTRKVTPAGDTIDIISHRIRIRGLLTPWSGVPLFHTGELSIEEDIRYVRPDLESPVLEKHCRVEISLDPR